MPELVSVAPGVYVDPAVHADIKPGQGYVMLDSRGLAKLGLSTCQDKTIRRLAHAGMIDLYPISPRCRLLKLDTWEKHLKSVSTDPDFWDRPINRKRWRIAVRFA